MLYPKDPFRNEIGVKLLRDRKAYLSPHACKQCWDAQAVEDEELCLLCQRKANDYADLPPFDRFMILIVRPYAILGLICWVVWTIAKDLGWL